MMMTRLGMLAAVDRQALLWRSLVMAGEVEWMFPYLVGGFCVCVIASYGMVWPASRGQAELLEGGFVYLVRNVR